ncbi:MAG: hypothetical protein AAF458_22205 [Pseudomonadota bacterium]
MAEREYMEERIDTLKRLGPGSLYDTRSREEINACVDRLRELIDLGAELLDMMSSANGDADIDRLRRWLQTDIDRQRMLLDDFRAQGFSGVPEPLPH